MTSPFGRPLKVPLIKAQLASMVSPARSTGDLMDLRVQTRTLINSFTARPPPDRLAAIDAFYGAVIAAGVLAKLDFLYLLAAADVQAACVNWVTPGVYTLTSATMPIFTVDRGFTGSGASSLLPGVGWTALTQFQPTSNHVGAWELSNVSDGTLAVGGASTGTVRLIPRTAAGILTGRLGDGTDIAGATVATATGHSLLNRSGASAREAYRDGVLLQADATAATSVGATMVAILRNSGVSSTRQLAVVHAGSSLTAGEVAALYAALYAYLVAVGAVS